MELLAPGARRQYSSAADAAGPFENHSLAISLRRNAPAWVLVQTMGARAEGPLRRTWKRRAGANGRLLPQATGLWRKDASIYAVDCNVLPGDCVFRTGSGTQT